MKKKLFLLIAIVATLVCLFAISVSAAEYNKTETVTVTLKNGTQECELYDAQGDALVWYTLDSGATVQSVKAKNLYSSSSLEELLVNATYLGDIYLDANTVLQKQSEHDTNRIVVANLRECNFKTLSHVSYKTTFGDSKMLQYVYIPNTLTNMGCNVFQNCTNLKVCDIPSDASFVISDANNFPGCTSLREINLIGCTSIVGHSNFSGCTSLTKVILDPNTINYASIANNTFNSAPLTQFGLVEGECTIPSTTTYIGNAAFLKSRFTKVIMSDSVTSLGWNTFADNTSLTEVYISNSLATSDIRVFENCTNLTTVKGLENCKLTTIPQEWFECTGTLQVVLPSTVTTIGNSAFKKSKITSISIPAGFTLIDDYAFQECGQLASVTFLGNAGENAVIDQAAFEK